MHIRTQEYGISNEWKIGLVQWVLSNAGLYFFSKQLDEVRRKIEMDILQAVLALNHALYLRA